MARYIVRRLLLMLAGHLRHEHHHLSLSRLVPGNPARLLAGPTHGRSKSTPLAERYHLTGPILEQYAVYMSGLAAR